MGTKKEKSTVAEGKEAPGTPAKGGAKRGPKSRPDGFRAECYQSLDKGIDRKTKMVVVKQRHRLASGVNVFPGDTFTAQEMDSRVIAAAMERYYIMPAKKTPKEGERRIDYVSRMMAEYEPGQDATTCSKKK